MYLKRTVGRANQPNVKESAPHMEHGFSKDAPAVFRLCRLYAVRRWKRKFGDLYAHSLPDCSCMLECPAVPSLTPSLPVPAPLDAFSPPLHTSPDRSVPVPDYPCGYGVALLSAASISAAMLQPNQYKPNAQVIDATIHLIRTLISQSVNVREICIDTIGQPGPYQKKPVWVFPRPEVTAEKEAVEGYEGSGFEGYV